MLVVAEIYNLRDRFLFLIRIGFFTLYHSLVVDLVSEIGLKSSHRLEIRQISFKLDLKSYH